MTEICDCGHDNNFHTTLDGSQCHEMFCKCRKFKPKTKGCGKLIPIDPSDKLSEGWICGQYYDSYKRVVFCFECSKTDKEIAKEIVDNALKMAKEKKEFNNLKVTSLSDKRFKVEVSGVGWIWVNSEEDIKELAKKLKEWFNDNDKMFGDHEFIDKIMGGFNDGSI